MPGFAFLQQLTGMHYTAQARTYIWLISGALAGVQRARHDSE